MGEVLRRRQAAETHEVVTVVETGDHGYRHRPCEPSAQSPGCPWRRDQSGQFPAEAFEHSAETAYDAADHLFGCHQSTPARPLTCAGFLLRGATHNLGARLALSAGWIDLSRVSDGGHDLYGSYREMAVANGVPADHPRLERCRDE